MQIEELKNYTGKDEVVNSHWLRESLKNDQPLRRYASKLPKLDELVKGFQEGELVALSGPRKMGKTLLAQTLTKNFLQQDAKSLWFSYEVGHQEFIKQYEAWGDLPLYYTPKKLKAYDMKWVGHRILEAILKYDAKVAFIDNLHFLFDMIRSRNAGAEIGMIVRQLKRICVEYNFVIFLLCHMRKVHPDKEPTDADFRDSSLIASETDTGLIIWRTKSFDNGGMLKVSYARRAGCWEEKFPIQKKHGFFVEYDTRTNGVVEQATQIFDGEDAGF